MKTKIEDWDESIPGVDDYQVKQAMTHAALDAIHRARRFGTYFVMEEMVKPSASGRMRPPYEKRFLEDLDCINRKIAELRAKQPNALELNEKAVKQT